MEYDENAVELSKHRLATAKKTFSIARLCFENEGYRDAVNRSYYATFYALRAVLALERVDFKRHKDVVAYFNQHYVATKKFNRDLGKRIGRLKTMREDCDYDDFFVVKLDDVIAQIETARMVLEAVEAYMAKQGVL
jgi:uncharacterized protein (UPF0332 family)